MTTPSQLMPTMISCSLRLRAPGGARSILAACLFATGCTSVPLRTAPIVERSAGQVEAKPVATAETVAPAASAAEARRSDYLVKKGDTLYSIALDHGQDYRDIAAWNQLSDANVIKVGQTLRVVPPEGVQATPVAAAPALESKPLTATPLPAALGKPSEAKVETKVDTAIGRPTETGGSSWAWPNAGQVVGSFVEGRSKGIDIAGKAGAPVLAAADGKVVYAGSGLRGYGNLVILKHNADFLSAYAHNSKILVKEGEAVKRGARIAEMGSSDSDRIKLHFEVRRQGKPVDPLKYLPER